MTIEEELEESKKANESLKTKLRSANSESEQRRDTIKTMQATIDGYDGIDMDKYKDALSIADAHSKDKLANQGKIEEVRSQVEAEFMKTVTKANNNADTWQKKYRSLAVDKDLLSAAAKNNAVDPAEVAILAANHIKMDDEGIVTVVDKDGHTMRNDSGDAMSIDSFMSDWLKDRPHHVKSDGGGSGSTGGKAHTSTATGSINRIEAGLKLLKG